MPPPRLQYSEFESFSRLFSAYAGEFAPLAAFFSGDFRDPRQRGQVARQVADHHKHREKLVEALTSQANSYGADQLTLDNIQSLGDPETVAVVTGQQLGLFGGPLYTLLKTITAIQLAERLSRDTGRKVVPVFWLEGEDHDLAEVASTAVFRGNDVASVTYTGADEAHKTNPQPVGRLKFDQSINTTIDELAEVLIPTEFSDEVLGLLRDSYKEGETFMSAFAKLMSGLFSDTGLIFVSGDDARLKEFAKPVFRKEIKEFDKSAKLLQMSSQKLADNYHVQVKSRPTSIFLMTDQGRTAVRVNEAGDKFECGDTSYSEAELLSLLDSNPELFSPNVVLRPIVQDTVLPTAAYIAGPGEVAYFAQFRPIYEWAGVPMPIIYPRASVTVLEPKIQKVLNQLELSITDFEGSLDEMFHSNVMAAMDIDAEAIFGRASQHLHDAINTVAPAIESVDQSLIKAAEATRSGLLKEWSKLRDRVIKAEKRRHDQTHDKMRRTQTNLFPLGTPQERLISPLYFANKYGLDFVTRLLHEIQLDTSEHQVILL
jgi:bacillithiol biosynthesis cysteine-adding enzyme BshC